MSRSFRTLPDQPHGLPYRSLCVAVLFLLSLLSPAISIANVKASVDKSDISFGETLELTLESDDQPESRPDLSPLTQDFEILDRRSNHRVSIVNGKRAEQQTLSLRLRPRRTGELSIPSISFGDKATESLQISVGAPATAKRAEEPGETNAPSSAASEAVSTPSALLEASLEPSDVYTKQQLLLTAKVLTDGAIQGSQLRDPQVSRAEILPLGEDRYETERHGKRYQVYERRYAIFPQDPGQFEVDPLVFEGWAPGKSSGNAGMGYGPSGQQIRAVSKTLISDVHRPPDDAGKKNWLPARSLSLSESGPATYQARPGRPIERRISLHADGILARDLPALGVPAPQQLARGPSQPRLWDERRPEGVIGNRLETILISAQEPGRYPLPAVSLDWWNTETGLWEKATLPARELVVSAAAAAGPRLPSPEANAQRKPRQPPAQAEQADRTAGAPAAPREAPQEIPATSNSIRIWIGIAVVLAMAWVATMLTWWRSRRRVVAAAPVIESAKPAEPREQTDPVQGRIDAVEAAYRTADAGAAREALLAWAAQVLPDQTPSNLARLAQRCPQPLRDQILLLEEAFFSPRPVTWNEQPVWEELAGFVPAPPEEPPSFRRGKPIRRRAVEPGTK